MSQPSVSMDLASNTVLPAAQAQQARPGTDPSRAEQSRSEFAAHLRQAGRDADPRSSRAVRSGATDQSDRPRSADRADDTDQSDRAERAAGQAAADSAADSAGNAATSTPAGQPTPVAPAAPAQAAAATTASAGPTAVANSPASGSVTALGNTPGAGADAGGATGALAAERAGASAGGVDGRPVPGGKRVDPGRDLPAGRTSAAGAGSVTTASATASGTGSATAVARDGSTTQTDQPARPLPSGQPDQTAQGTVRGPEHPAPAGNPSLAATLSPLASASGAVQSPVVPTVSGVAAGTATSTTTAPVPTPNANHPGVAGQLAASLRTLSGRSDGVHVMTVRLHPDDLGPVRVVARLTGADVHLRVTTSTLAAAAAVTEAAPRLHDALSGAGLNATGVSVDHDSDLSGQQPGAGGSGASTDPRGGAQPGSAQAGRGYGSGPPEGRHQVDIAPAVPQPRHRSARSLDLHV
jgi:flagellar hook-length control protein FliK